MISATRLLRRAVRGQCQTPRAPWRSLLSTQTDKQPEPAQPEPAKPDFTQLGSRIKQAAAAEPVPPAPSTPSPSPSAFQQPPMARRRPGSSLLDDLDQRLLKQKQEAQAAEQARQQASQDRKLKPIFKRKAEELFDENENLREREMLMKEAFAKGYWSDFKEVAKKGAKLWEAPDVMRAGQYSPVVPNVSGTLMDGRKSDVLEYVKQNKATLVVYYFNAFGEKQVESFIKPFLDEFKDHPHVDLLILNVEEKTQRAPILWLASPYVRFRTHVDRRPRTMIVYKDISEERKKTGMSNNVLGWVNLVDSTGRIRWQAHGNATAKELASVSSLARKLALI
ncbi:ATP10 protein-domain-containing protein [Entophlyctis helioformis]|nr:ATP10 protein-domain-containing protein [Entophlyctis helioformis]